MYPEALRSGGEHETSACLLSCDRLFFEKLFRQKAVRHKELENLLRTSYVR